VRSDGVLKEIRVFTKGYFKAYDAIIYLDWRATILPREDKS